MDGGRIEKWWQHPEYFSSSSYFLSRKKNLNIRLHEKIYDSFDQKKSVLWFFSFILFLYSQWRIRISEKISSSLENYAMKSSVTIPAWNILDSNTGYPNKISDKYLFFFIMLRPRPHYISSIETIQWMNFR